MKTNKKFIVSSLATIMAVSMVGAITGTVAWYQYNTRATVSMIGMNAAETGILEISATSATTGFKRDLTTADLLTAAGRTDFNLTPVTFAGGNVTAAALPLVGGVVKAYKNPDKSSKTVVEDGGDYATRGSYATNWDEASATEDYIQYAIYVRALNVDNVSGGLSLSAEDVYLTDYVFEKIGTADITEAMRIHLAIDADGDGTDESWYLLSKSAVAGIALHGMLDQDNDGIADRIGGYEWAQHRDDHIDYGKGNEYTQTATTLESQKAARDSSNNYAILAADSGKKLFTTPTVTNKASRITVTIWVEGWDRNLGETTVTSYSFAATDPAPTVGTTVVTSLFEAYNLGASPVAGNYVQSKGDADGKAVSGVTYYTRTADAATKVADWSGENTDGAQFKLGFTFDVGRGAFAD